MRVVSAAIWFAIGFTCGEIACLVLMFVLLPVLHRAGHKEWT